jgi:hypothetical protein
VVGAGGTGTESDIDAAAGTVWVGRGGSRCRLESVKGTTGVGLALLASSMELECWSLLLEKGPVRVPCSCGVSRAGLCAKKSFMLLFRDFAMTILAIEIVGVVVELGARPGRLGASVVREFDRRVVRGVTCSAH